MTASENIKAQERLLELTREAVANTGPLLVAERLGITEEELDRRIAFFSDLTLTELRLLAIAMEVEIHFWFYDPKSYSRDNEFAKLISPTESVDELHTDATISRTMKNEKTDE